MIIRRTLAALAIGVVLTGATATGATAGVPEGMTKDAYRALHARSEALNTLYRDAPQASAPVASTSASTPFAWDDFGIGMAAAFGLVLLTGGLVVAVRTGTRNRVRITS